MTPYEATLASVKSVKLKLLAARLIAAAEDEGYCIAICIGQVDSAPILSTKLAPETVHQLADVFGPAQKHL